MKRPWKVIHHELRDGDLVERVESFATVEAAARAFEVAVMFDVTARLVHREERPSTKGAPPATRA